MLLRRIYHDGLAQASYLIGCQATGEALVVDPNRNIEQYLAAAQQAELRIVAVTETHIHADYVSGARELAEHTGARLYLSGAGPAEWQYAFAAEAGATLLHDGDTFSIGNIRIEARHTPGHTPEHIAFLVTDTAGADEPIGLLSGDFVFVGDVGRPDLLERAAGFVGTMEDGARRLFGSLTRFRALPDYMQIWPGHGAGSACGKALGAVPQSTVGYERRFNWALGIHDEAAFVQAVLAGQPDPPPYFAQMKRINKLGPAPRPRELPPQQSVEQLAVALRGAQVVVDTRPSDEFAMAHVPGTINIPFEKLMSWAGWLLPYDRPLGLIAAPEQLAAIRDELQLIGLDALAAYWAPEVVEAWRRAGRALAAFSRQPAQAVRALVAANHAQLLDVRTPAEHADGHIPGSRHIPLGQLPRQIGTLDPARRVIVYCQGGGRSPIAASLLTGQGFTDVVEIRDGFAAWQAEGSAVERAKG